MSSTEVVNANGPAADYKPRLLLKYRNEVVPSLREKFAYENVMQIPRLQKITLNMGVGEATRDIKELDAAEKELMIIAGQKPSITRARKAISTFKVRVGMPVGCFTTLRGARMWEFMDRLVHVALPRVRDFRGIPGKSFDGRGNYSMGVREHLIFLELDYNQISHNRGLDITFVTSANTDAEAKELLRLLGMPFRN